MARQGPEKKIEARMHASTHTAAELSDGSTKDQGRSFGQSAKKRQLSTKKCASQSLAGCTMYSFRLVSARKKAPVRVLDTAVNDDWVGEKHRDKILTIRRSAPRPFAPRRLSARYRGASGIANFSNRSAPHGMPQRSFTLQGKMVGTNRRRDVSHISRNALRSGRSS